MFCLHNNMHFASIFTYHKLRKYLMHISEKECVSWRLNKKVSINKWAPMLLVVAYKYCLSTIILKEATHMWQFFEQLWIDPKMIALTDFFCPHWWLSSRQIEKELLNHWKGTSNSVIFNPNNWSSWHLLLTWYHAQLVDSALLHHIHSFLAAWCIIVLYCHFSFSHHVLLEILHFRKCMHDKEHERHLLLTYHQLIPPFSVVTPSKPQVSLCCIITFVFCIIMLCDDPSFEEQSVCMRARNMKTWFQMFQPCIHIYKDL